MGEYILSCCSTADMPKEFFEERKIHKSEDDSIDKELRRLLNIKIAKIWNEEYQKEFDDLPFDTMTPHQKIIYKQIEGW